ncbi:MAG: hypothetical protein NW220_17880 [Leptolyngbyaceae cyanobacterium bins.349]|nr:hypothetical protein [Leptolyngbyaceae cyanobacterium bins.349]
MSKFDTLWEPYVKAVDSHRKSKAKNCEILFGFAEKLAEELGLSWEEVSLASSPDGSRFTPLSRINRFDTQYLQSLSLGQWFAWFKFGQENKQYPPSRFQKELQPLEFAVPFVIKLSSEEGGFEIEVLTDYLSRKFAFGSAGSASYEQLSSFLVNAMRRRIDDGLVWQLTEERLRLPVRLYTKPIEKPKAETDMTKLLSAIV